MLKWFWQSCFSLFLHLNCDFTFSSLQTCSHSYKRIPPGFIPSITVPKDSFAILDIILQCGKKEKRHKLHRNLSSFLYFVFLFCFSTFPFFLMSYVYSSLLFYPVSSQRQKRQEKTSVFCHHCCENMSAGRKGENIPAKEFICRIFFLNGTTDNKNTYP